MSRKIKERVIKVANYIIETNSTIRETSKVFHVSKSTIHKDIQERLYNIDKNKYKDIQEIMQEHLRERHLKGGESTRQLFLKKRALTL